MYTPEFTIELITMVNSGAYTVVVYYKQFKSISYHILSYTLKKLIYDEMVNCKDLNPTKNKVLYDLYQHLKKYPESKEEIWQAYISVTGINMPKYFKK